MAKVARLSAFLNLPWRRTLLVLMGMMVLHSAHANITRSSITQSPVNNVTPGQDVTYAITLFSDAVDATDTPVIAVSVNGQDISTSNFASSFTSSDCSLDGSFYCDTGIDSTQSQTYHITWKQPPAGSYQVLFRVTCNSSGGQGCVGTVQGYTTVVANALPVAVPDTATTTPGTAVNINLLANDTIPKGQQVFVKLPSTSANATIVNNNDGTITYTPNSGFTGTDNFSYNIVDANGNTLTTGSVSVTVSLITKPTANNDTAKTTSGTAVLINMLANDQIPQGQQVSVASISTPKNGSVVNNNDGTATYTPNSGFKGTDTFTYTLANSDGLSVATGIVTVTVSSTNSGPQAITNLKTIPNLTDNQRSVATVVDQLCATSTDSSVVSVCDLIATLSTNDQLTALQQITPDQLAAQGTTAVETSTAQLTNIKLRLMALRGGAGGGLSMNGFSMDIKGTNMPMGALLAAMQDKGGGGASGDILGSGRLGVFVNGRINFGSLDTTSRETGFDFNTNGITMGVDYRFTDAFVAGGALGYASTSSTYSGNGGKMDSSDISISTYGSYYMPRNAYIDWIATYGSTNYDTTRNMTFSGFSTQASGNPGGDQFTLSLNTGMDFNRRDLLFTPYARLEYSSNSIDAYQESGGSGLALGYNSQTIESLTTALAGRISKAMSMNWGILTPSAHVEWEHQYKDNNRLITAHFVADPSASFSVATDSPDRNYFNVGFGMSATLPEGRSAFIDYEAVIGQDHVTNSTIDLGVRLAF